MDILGGIKDITGIGAVAKFGEALLDRFIENPEEKRRAKEEYDKQVLNGDLQALAIASNLSLGQIETNKIEAASSSVFVAGWRPAIGWICAIALLNNFAIIPLMTWVATVFKPGLAVPPPLSDQLFELVLAMLGVGALRTYEKIRKVAR